MAKIKTVIVMAAILVFGILWALPALVKTVTGPDHNKLVMIDGHYRKAIDVSAEGRLMNDAKIFRFIDMQWNVSGVRVEECDVGNCVVIVVGLDGDTCVYSTGEDGMVTRQAITDGLQIRIDGKNSETVMFPDIEGKIKEHLVGSLRETSGAELGSC